MADTWADDPDVEVGSKSGPIPGWPADDVPVTVPPEFLPSGEDEDRADPELDA